MIQNVNRDQLGVIMSHTRFIGNHRFDNQFFLYAMDETISL